MLRAAVFEHDPAEAKLTENELKRGGTVNGVYRSRTE